MATRRINNFVSGLSNNALILLLASATGILSYFADYREDLKLLFRMLGVNSSPTLIDLFAIIYCITSFAGLFSIVKYVSERKYRKRLSIFDASVGTVLWADGAGERIREFQELRNDSTSSMLVMGVGMTFFSRDMAYLEKLLEKRQTVRLLMLDPNVIANSFPISPVPHFIISPSFFDQYFHRPDYSIDVKTSYNRLESVARTFSNEHFPQI